MSKGSEKMLSMDVEQNGMCSRVCNSLWSMLNPSSAMA